MSLKQLALIAALSLGFFSAQTAYAEAALIRGQSSTSVYYSADDGKRYVFPNSKAYFSWYSDFRNVSVVSDATIASLRIGGNITYRPGKRIIKIQTDPKIYAISPGGILRWITSEQIAEALYGADWADQVDDVPDVYFGDYAIGDAINSLNDYSTIEALAQGDTIRNDLIYRAFRTDNQSLSETPSVQQPLQSPTSSVPESNIPTPGPVIPQPEATIVGVRSNPANMPNFTVLTFSATGGNFLLKSFSMAPVTTNEAIFNPEVVYGESKFFDPQKAQEWYLGGRNCSVLKDIYFGNFLVPYPYECEDGSFGSYDGATDQSRNFEVRNGQIGKIHIPSIELRRFWGHFVEEATGRAVDIVL